LGSSLLDGCVLGHGESESCAGGIADEGLAQTAACLNVDFRLNTVRRVRSVDHVSVLRLHNLLDQHSHVDLVQTRTKLFHGEESSLIELAGPDFLDSSPRFGEVGAAKLLQSLLQFLNDGIVCVCSLVLQVEHDLLAAEETASHLVNFLRFGQTAHQSLHSCAALRIAHSQAVLHDFERKADGFGHVHPVRELLFQHF